SLDHRLLDLHVDGLVVERAFQNVEMSVPVEVLQIPERLRSVSSRLAGLQRRKILPELLRSTFGEREEMGHHPALAVHIIRRHFFRGRGKDVADRHPYVTDETSTVFRGKSVSNSAVIQDFARSDQFREPF